MRINVLSVLDIVGSYIGHRKDLGESNHHSWDPKGGPNNILKCQHLKLKGKNPFLEN